MIDKKIQTYNKVNWHEVNNYYSYMPTLSHTFDYWVNYQLRWKNLSSVVDKNLFKIII